MFETEIIKLCMKTDILGLEERISKLEKGISNNIPERGNVNNTFQASNINNMSQTTNITNNIPKGLICLEIV